MRVYAFIDSRILSKLKYVDSEYHVFEKMKVVFWKNYYR